MDRHSVERDGFGGKRLDGERQRERDRERWRDRGKMRRGFIGGMGYIQSRIQSGRRAKFVPKWFILLIVYLLVVLKVVHLDYI